MSTVSKIYCLVRASDAHAAMERVNKSLLQRGKIGLDFSDGSGRISCVVAKLGDSKLGLSPETYQRISNETNAVIHVCYCSGPCTVILDGR